MCTKRTSVELVYALHGPCAMAASRFIFTAQNWCWIITRTRVRGGSEQSADVLVLAASATAAGTRVTHRPGYAGICVRNIISDHIRVFLQYDLRTDSARTKRSDVVTMCQWHRVRNIVDVHEKKNKKTDRRVDYENNRTCVFLIFVNETKYVV